MSSEILLYLHAGSAYALACHMEQALLAACAAVRVYQIPHADHQLVNPSAPWTADAPKACVMSSKSLLYMRSLFRAKHGPLQKRCLSGGVRCMSTHADIQLMDSICVDASDC